MEMFLQKLGLILENKVCTFNFKIPKNVIINRKHNSFLKPFSPRKTKRWHMYEEQEQVHFFM